MKKKKYQNYFVVSNILCTFAVEIKNKFNQTDNIAGHKNYDYVSI